MIKISKNYRPEERPIVIERGTLSLEQFLKLYLEKENYNLTDCMRNSFNPTVRSYCPPIELLSLINVPCSKCVECYQECSNLVKEQKLQYKIGKNKISKKKLEGLEYNDLFPEDFFEPKETFYKNIDRRRKRAK